MPSLLAILGLDANPFARGLAGATSKAKAAGNQIASSLSSNITSKLAGLASVGAITAFSKETIEWASNLRDTADMLGVNVEWLQRMQNGAKLVGADIEDLAKVINEVGKSREDALRNPAGKNAKALNRLGISGGDTANLSQQDFIDKIVAAFKGGATTQLVNDVEEVGGKSARNLIAAFANQFQSDAPILAEDLVDQLDEAGDKFTDFATQLKVDFAPALISAIDGIRGFINWMKQLGAFIGGFLSAFDFNLIRQAKNPVQHIKDVIKNFMDSITAGGQQAADLEKEQKAQADSEAKAHAVARDARRKRENAAPKFEDIVLGKAKELALNANQKIGAQAYISPEARAMMNAVRNIDKGVQKIVLNTNQKAGAQADSTQF